MAGSDQPIRAETNISMFNAGAWLSYATYLNAGIWFLNYSPWASETHKATVKGLESAESVKKNL